MLTRQIRLRWSLRAPVDFERRGREGEEWCRRTLGGAGRRSQASREGSRPAICEPLCCLLLLVAHPGRAMKLALLPWILMLLVTIRGPKSTAGNAPLCPQPSLFICLIRQAGWP